MPAKKMIVVCRSRAAATAYREAIAAGWNEAAARIESENALFKGLVFSKYDTVRSILALEFPNIPSDRKPRITEKLLPLCETVFINYDLRDDFLTKPVYRDMIKELTKLIRHLLDDLEMR